MFLFRPEKIIMCPGRLSRFLFWIRSASVSCLLLVIVLSPAALNSPNNVATVKTDHSYSYKVTFHPKEVTQVSPIPMDIEAMDEKIMQKD